MFIILLTVFCFIIFALTGEPYALFGSVCGFFAISLIILLGTLMNGGLV